MHLNHWRTPERGALFVVTGPSGTGKTTLVKQALATIPGIAFSVSATTRGARAGEVDGVDYHFLTRDRFDARLAAGDLLEWAEVYGNRYGTLRAPVEAALGSGQSVLLEIDIQGARQVRAAMPDARLLFVLPPSVDALEQRLRRRATDSEAIIQRRVAEAKLQLAGVAEFDYLVVNDDLDTAHACFQACLMAELLRRERHPALVASFERAAAPTAT